MRLPRTALAAAVAASVVFALVPPAAAEGPCTWTLIDDIPLPEITDIRDVDALASNDVWIVGMGSDGSMPFPLARHWDGDAWEEVPVPNFGELGAGLRAIEAIAPDDIWAVGEFRRPHTRKGFVVHWDGSTWSVVPTPHVQGRTSLDSVSAAEPDDVWVAGNIDYRGRGNPNALLEHWNGRAWRVLQPPDEAPIRDVAAVSGRRAWAITAADSVKTWDGVAWRRTRFPGKRSQLLISVSDLGWIAGGTRFSGGHPLAAQWNGTRWRLIPTNAGEVSEFGANAEDVAGNRPRNVWLVGTYSTGLDLFPLVEHWNGRRWRLVQVSVPGLQSGSLFAVDIAGGQAWTVGDRYDLGPDPSSFVLRWSC